MQLGKRVDIKRIDCIFIWIICIFALPLRPQKQYIMSPMFHIHSKYNFYFHLQHGMDNRQPVHVHWFNGFS